MSFISRLFGISGKPGITDRIYGATDTGKIRKNNEDYFLIDPDKKLFIAADGMGGGKAGEVGSINATKAVDEYFDNNLLDMIRGDDEMIKAEMNAGLLFAHQKILDIAKRNRRYKGMGCTIVVALVDGNKLHLCHVGDARAYLLKNSMLELLTTDHSYVLSLVKMGKMTLEEARDSPIKNKIIQAIGVPENITPEYNQYDISPGDKFLLCSDGLWDMLPDSRIHQILKKRKSAKDISNMLVKKANKAGGRDNITVVVGYH